MVLKIVKEKNTEDTSVLIEDGERYITEYYEGKHFKLQNGFITTDKESIDVDRYSLYDEVLGVWFEYETKELYLMNNEGKTIERLK